MKGILTVIVLAHSMYSFSQEAVMQGDITRPVLGQRCNELFVDRNNKIRIQQRLNALLQRNEELIKKSPESKQVLSARLNSTRVKIKNELYLANLQIEAMEENIVRSGCPGLSLR